MCFSNGSLFPQNTSYRINFSQEIFFVSFFNDARDVHIWITILAGPAKAENFNYQVKLFNENGENLSYLGKIHSICKKPEKIIIEGSGFTVPSRFFSDRFGVTCKLTLGNL